MKKIDDIIVEVPNATITAKPPETPPVQQTFDIHQYAYSYWAYKKPKFLADYTNGKNRGNITTKKLTPTNILNELMHHLSQTIVYLYNKNNKTTETLQNVLTILESSVKIISKDIEKADMKNLEIEEFIAAFQGIINSYVDKQLGDRL